MSQLHQDEKATITERSLAEYEALPLSDKVAGFVNTADTIIEIWDKVPNKASLADYSAKVAALRVVRDGVIVFNPADKPSCNAILDKAMELLYQYSEKRKKILQSPSPNTLASEELDNSTKGWFFLQHLKRVANARDYAEEATHTNAFYAALTTNDKIPLKKERYTLPLLKENRQGFTWSSQEVLKEIDGILFGIPKDPEKTKDRDIWESAGENIEGLRTLSEINKLDADNKPVISPTSLPELIRQSGALVALYKQRYPEAAAVAQGRIKGIQTFVEALDYIQSQGQLSSQEAIDELFGPALVHRTVQTSAQPKDAKVDVPKRAINPERFAAVTARILTGDSPSASRKKRNLPVSAASKSAKTQVEVTAGASVNQPEEDADIQALLAKFGESSTRNDLVSLAPDVDLGEEPPIKIKGTNRGSSENMKPKATSSAPDILEKVF